MDTPRLTTSSRTASELLFATHDTSVAYPVSYRCGPAIPGMLWATQSSLDRPSSCPQWTVRRFRSSVLAGICRGAARVARPTLRHRDRSPRPFDLAPGERPDPSYCDGGAAAEHLGLGDQHG